MSNQSLYENNPLHGLKLDTLVEQLVTHYGFEILSAATNLNCFKTHPSIASSIKFLKKTEWAREKLEDFYLYYYKSLPKPHLEEFEISPRSRIIPSDQTPGEPTDLTVEELIEQRERRIENYETKRAAKRNSNASKRAGNRDERSHFGARNNRNNDRNHDRNNRPSAPVDPWANFNNKS